MALKTPPTRIPTIAPRIERMIKAGMDAIAHLMINTTMLPNGMSMSVTTTDVRVTTGALMDGSGRGSCRADGSDTEDENGLKKKNPP
jgi:hypothetical protein